MAVLEKTCAIRLNRAKKRKGKPNRLQSSILKDYQNYHTCNPFTPKNSIGIDRRFLLSCLIYASRDKLTLGG